MKTQKLALLNTEKEISTLDHLAPLAFILNIPLYTESSNNFKRLQHYYPKVKSIHKNKFKIAYFSNNYDGLISCHYWNPKLRIIFDNIYDKNIKLVFCPHGNSDKGHIAKQIFKTYLEQDGILLYGNHMIDILKKQKLFRRLKKYAIIGNYRELYYKKHKAFYDKIIEKEVFATLNPRKKTILYAPTWNDMEDSSSLTEIYKHLINSFDQDYNLIIKPHCSTLDNTKDFLKDLKDSLPSNIILLDDYPLIYPLLNRTDIYLGDFSSIGYDFLCFQRPMFFLDKHSRDPKNNPSLFLHRCGIQIPKKNWSNIFSFIKKHENKSFKAKQKQIYEYAFGKNQKISTIRKNIQFLI